MSSTLIVPVVKLENVREHPNADKLELADVLGYQMCVPKGRHRDGDKVVYFPADTLIPDEWSEKFGVKQFLKGADKNRVSRVKLRGEPSFGLVVNLPEGEDWEVGENVSEYYNAKKYEPPIKPIDGDTAMYDENINPFFFKYTDIENGRIYVDVFENGEEVVATEKIHGTNSRVGVINEIQVAGSHTTRRKRPFRKVPVEIIDGLQTKGEEDCDWDDEEMKRSTYWFPWTIKNVRSMLNNLACGHKQVLLYGEVYGRSIQDLGYGIEKRKGLGYRAFDLMIDGKYLDYDEFMTRCLQFGVETVPVIYRGEFDIEKIKKVADGKTTLIENGHMREGVVVKPIKEKIDVKIGRVVLKYIGTEYELKRKSDFTDI